ncbi:MAG: extracellular solute-binding protein [Patescibacteria group bacterium]
MALPPIPKSRLIIAGVLGFIFLLGVLIFLGIFPGLRKDRNSQTVTLTFWGVDDLNAMNAVISSLGKGYRVTYQGFPEDRYESELVDALAEGRGPDVFMIRSSWLPKHAGKLIPASEAQLSLRTFQALYPTVAEQDFAPDGLIYAVPLSLDTLSLIYNPEFLDSAGIPTPPNTWVEFEAAVKELRRLDAAGRIVRAGAAIGGTQKSIPYVKDILSALFIQAGAPMVRTGFTGADFARAGEDSLRFYTNFANPSNASYTWNDVLPESIESFSQERTAIVFGYARDLKKISERNATLSVKVAPLPQPAAAAKNYTVADYWGIGVSKKFSNPSGAWGFALAVAADPVSANLYARTIGTPPALKGLIAQNAGDPILGIFGDQALYARSWPEPNPEKVQTIFSEMVDAVLTGKKTIDTSIRDAEAAVGQLIAGRLQTF